MSNNTISLLIKFMIISNIGFQVFTVSTASGTPLPLTEIDTADADRESKGSVRLCVCCLLLHQTVQHSVCLSACMVCVCVCVVLLLLESYNDLFCTACGNVEQRKVHDFRRCVGWSRLSLVEKHFRWVNATIV